MESSAPEGASSPHITVERRGGGYTDRARAYSVLVDGREVAKLKHGESHTERVTPGEHEVQMKIDWAVSPAVQVSLEPGSHSHLFTYPNANPFTALWYISFGRSKYLALERKPAA